MPLWTVILNKECFFITQFCKSMCKCELTCIFMIRAKWREVSLKLCLLKEDKTASFKVWFYQSFRSVTMTIQPGDGFTIQYHMHLIISWSSSTPDNHLTGRWRCKSCLYWVSFKQIHINCSFQLSYKLYKSTTSVVIKIACILYISQ
jgi:hypothetical protein